MHQAAKKNHLNIPSCYVIKKESRKGQPCGMPAFNESKLCSIHATSGKSMDVERRVQFLERKLKSFNQLVMRWK